MALILAVEDDLAIRRYLTTALRERGHLVEETATLRDALLRIGAGEFDLWIFDRKLPDGDSLSALAQLRAEGHNTPALFLTAAFQLEQRVAGLEAGADDYLTKPFSLTELLARVSALLRRRPLFVEPERRVGNLVVKIASHGAVVNGQDIRATTNEWRLLALLAEQPGRVFSRDAIMSRVGISAEADEIAVDHLVSRIRQKLRSLRATASIDTVRGVGFAMNPLSEV